MTALRIELRRGPGLWALPILVAVGAFAARGGMRTPAVWSYATGGVAGAGMLMAPIAAGLAAWAGSRAGRRGVRHVMVLAAREPLIGPVIECLAIAVCVLFAYVLTAIAVFVQTALAATWGGPSWLWLAAAGSGLLAVTTLGYVTGFLVPKRLTPFFAAILTYLLLAWNLAQDGRWWHFLFPATAQLWLPFNTLRGATLWGQLAWLTGLTVLPLAVLALRLRSGVRAIASLVAVAVAGLGLGAGLLIGGDGRFADFNRALVWQCSGTEPEVCIHPAFAASLPDIRGRADAAADRLRRTPFAIHRVEQRPRGVGGQPGPGAVAYALDAPAKDDYDRAATDIATGALGVDPACVGRDSEPKAGLVMAQLLVAWAADSGSAFVPINPDERQALAWFRGLPLTEQQEWVTAHAPAMRTCSLVPGDFR
ncbi:MAG TPA: hypothetical protein VGP31_19490 [Planosporangium sp.]|jgi:hypothetical protein|nr:hypothetical protein [Planosporangium sp.]